MNEEILKGKWNDIKGEIRKTWGKITGDEIEQTKGNITSISGLIQQKYGLAKEEASQKLTELMNRYGAEAEEKTDSVKQSLRN